MRRAALAALVLIVAGCAGDTAPDRGAGRHPVLQQPSVYEPGLHVSGYADFGVSGRF